MVEKQLNFLLLGAGFVLSKNDIGTSIVLGLIVLNLLIIGYKGLKIEESHRITEQYQSQKTINTIGNNVEKNNFKQKYSEADVQDIKNTTHYDSSYIKTILGDAENITLSPEMEQKIVNDYEELTSNQKLQELSDNAFNLQMNQDYDGALISINKALMISPYNVYILNKKAGAEGGIGNWDNCINILKNITDYPPAIKGLATCYFGKKDYGNSLFYTYRGLELFPNDIHLKMIKDKMTTK